MEQVQLDRIVDYDINIIPETVEKDNTISIKNTRNGYGCDWVSVKNGHGLREEDYLIVRGKNYKILAITDDDAGTFLPNTRNIIRVNREFENNVTNQKLRYRRKPTVCGQIIELPKASILPHQLVTIDFKDINSNDHGNVEICFHNLIFNSSCYLTHGRARVVSKIPEV